MSDLVDGLKGLMAGKDKSTETASLLLETENNLNSKTEIYNPYSLAYLTSIANVLDTKNDKTTKTVSDFLLFFIEEYKTLMISKDRKGRTEVIEVFKLLKEQELLMRRGNLLSRLTERAEE